MHYRKLHLCLYPPRGHIARSFSEHGIRSLRGRERIVPSVLQTFSALCACGILGSEVGMKKLFGFLLLAALLSSCIFAPPAVRYEVTGTASSVGVTYENESGGTPQEG